jgi:hypothetical protein
MIKCKLKVDQGDSGGVLFKTIPESRDNNNKVKCIAVGICSYFLPIAGKNYGDVSYFVPLTDLDQSIYVLPLPTSLALEKVIPQVSNTEGYTKSAELDFRRGLQDNIDNETLKCIKSFEFYYDKVNKSHASFSIIDPSEETDLQEDKEKVKSLMENAFGYTENPVLIDYDLNSGDFLPGMINQNDETSVDEDNANVAAFFPSNPSNVQLGNTSTCDFGPGMTGTCTLGLMIKLKPNNLKGIEKIIPDLDITKDIYANVGASHTAPRILKIHRSSRWSSYVPFLYDADSIAHELNVAGFESLIVRNKKMGHLYNDLEIFVIQNNRQNSLLQFEAWNTFDESFTDCEGNKEKFKGYIAHVVRKIDFRTIMSKQQLEEKNVDINTYLQRNDEVYFLGQHNKSKGKVTGFLIPGNANQIMIMCNLKVQRGDSGGVLFKPIPESRDNNNKVKCTAVGICSYFNIKNGVSYFVPLTDLDESIYELPVTSPPT